MRASELRDKTTQELKDLLIKTQKDYQALVTDVLQRKEKNVKKLVGLRKTLARIKTVLNEKDILAESASVEEK